MYKSSKTIWILTGIVIFSLFVYIGIQHRKINKLGDANQLQAVELCTLKDSVLVYKSKSGELTYKLSSVEIEKGNLKKSLELMGIDKLILKERDIEWRRLTSALRLELAATGTGTTTLRDTFEIVKSDTLRYSDFAWKNDFLSFSGNIRDERLTFDYTYKTGISILQTQNRKATIVSVSLTDPNAAIVSGNSITIKHKKKIWERGWLWAAVGFGTGILISR